MTGAYIVLERERTVSTTVMESSRPSTADSEQQGSQLETPAPESAVPAALFSEDDVSGVVQQWARQVGGDVGVVLLDTEGGVIAESSGDEVFFAASIYKLYVAYFGYQSLDNGMYDPQEAYINGHTRAECLDLMIRESDSPCAEKLWVELGKQQLTDQLQDFGILNTDMTSITTTASDAAMLLVRVARGDGLSDSSQAAFIDSLLEQPDRYRAGLPDGFSADGTLVYNKVGWNGQLEWHDTAIVTLDDERQFILAVLTSGVGSKNVADLARQIEAVILE